MMGNNEMIYTAIFQGAQGNLRSARYLDVFSRKAAWLSATRIGSAAGECLIALVSGDHPVYFYENFVEDTAREDRTPTQNHDVFEMT